MLHSWFYYSVCRCALSDTYYRKSLKGVSKLSNGEVLHISARPFVDICWCGSDVTGFWKSSSSFRKSGAFGFGSIVYWSVFILETQESASGTKQNLPSKEINLLIFIFITASPALRVVGAYPREMAGVQTELVTSLSQGHIQQFTLTLTPVDNLD